MEFLDYYMTLRSSTAKVNLHFIGDTHIGAKGCLEKELIKRIEVIRKDKNARAILPGDLIDGILRKDPRFDMREIPDWMFEKAKKENGGFHWDSAREALSTIGEMQIQRAIEIFYPIKKQIIGINKGNHCHSLLAHNGVDAIDRICRALDVPNLTDCAIVRLNFKCLPKNAEETTRNNSRGATVTLWIEHGSGGSGRLSGSENNVLQRIMAKHDCDITVRGHSHKPAIITPDSFLSVVKNTSGPKHAKSSKVTFKERFAGNCGSYLMTYELGPDTYGSRASYKPNSFRGLMAVLRPFARSGQKIDLRLIPIDGIEK